jgi:hypothetical protein
LEDDDLEVELGQTHAVEVGLRELEIKQRKNKSHVAATNARVHLEDYWSSHDAYQ